MTTHSSPQQFMKAFGLENLPWLEEPVHKALSYLIPRHGLPLIRKHLKDWAEGKSGKAMIYGAGGITPKILPEPWKDGPELIGLIDGDPKQKGKKLNGLTVYSPEQALGMNPDNVLIASYYHQDAIHESLSFMRDASIETRKIFDAAFIGEFASSLRNNKPARNRGKPTILFAYRLIQPHLLKWTSGLTYGDRFSRNLLIFGDYHRRLLSPGLFDRVFLCRHRFGRLLDIVLTSPADVIQVESSFNVLGAFVAAFSPVPIVYAPFDILSYWPDSRVPPVERAAERFCFERAEGLIHTGPQWELDYLRSYNKVPPKTLQLLPYCNPKYFISAKGSSKRGAKKKEYHLVYIGIISPKGDSNPDIMNEANYLRLAKDMAEVGFHYHIYPSPFSTPGDYPHYKALDRSNPLVHLHRPVRFADLTKEISRYDFGMLCPDFRNFDLPRIWKSVAMANKLFTYLEAGLPLIVHSDMSFIAQIIKEYDIGIGTSLDSFENLYDSVRRADLDRLRRNVLRAREDLSIKNRWKAMESFYSSVAGREPEGL